MRIGEIERQGDREREDRALREAERIVREVERTVRETEREVVERR